MSKFLDFRSSVVVATAIVASLISSAAFANWNLCGNGYIETVWHDRTGQGNVFLVLPNMDTTNNSYADVPTGSGEAIKIKDASGSGSGYFGRLASVLQAAYLAGSWVGVFSEDKSCNHHSASFLVVVCTSSTDSACG